MPPTALLPLFPTETRPLVAQILAEPPRSLTALAREVADYRVTVAAARRSSEFVDVELARRIADACDKLLEALPPAPSERQLRLARIAVRYFVLEDDAEGDLTSVAGFDDDADVLNVVLQELGFERWCVEL